MTGKLHRAKRIAKNLNSEVKRLTKKFLSTGFPATFIKNIIECFIWVKNDFVIPKYLFDERKLIIVRLPFPGWKKKVPKSVIKNFLYLQNINVNSNWLEY